MVCVWSKNKKLHKWLGMVIIKDQLPNYLSCHCCGIFVGRCRRTYVQAQLEPWTFGLWSWPVPALLFLMHLLLSSFMLYNSFPLSFIRFKSIFHFRKLEEDTTIDGLKMPKGATVGIFVHMLHRNPLIWDDPDKFDPDRFLNQVRPWNKHPQIPNLSQFIKW